MKTSLTAVSREDSLLSWGLLQARCSAVWLGQAEVPGLLWRRNSSSNSAATCPSARPFSQGMKAHIPKYTTVNSQAY